MSSAHSLVVPSFATLIHEARAYAEQVLSARGAVQAAYLTHIVWQEGTPPSWWVDVFFARQRRGVTLELCLQPDGTFLILPLAEGSSLPSQERLALVQRQHAQLQAQRQGSYL